MGQMESVCVCRTGWGSGPQAGGRKRTATPKLHCVPNFIRPRSLLATLSAGQRILWL